MKTLVFAWVVLANGILVFWAAARNGMEVGALPLFIPVILGWLCYFANEHYLEQRRRDVDIANYVLGKANERLKARGIGTSFRCTNKVY